jgi:hypothetical protein
MANKLRRAVGLLAAWFAIACGGGTQPANVDVDVDPNACGISSGQCSITAAEISCNDDSDCTTYSVPNCIRGVTPTIGVNKTSAIDCVGEPCAAFAGVETQDCSVFSQDSCHFVEVQCFAHQCQTGLSGCLN